MRNKVAKDARAAAKKKVADAAACKLAAQDPSPRQSCPATVHDEASALAFLKANYREVMDICGISRQAVLQWTRVPAESCPRLFLAFGIPWQVMRPDLFQMKDTKNDKGIVKSKEIEKLARKSLKEVNSILERLTPEMKQELIEANNRILNIVRASTARATKAHPFGL